MWRFLLPTGKGTPMPDKALMAMLTVALHWGKTHVALLLAIGLLGLRHVHEIRCYRFECFLTPCRLLSENPVMLVLIDGQA